MMRQRLVGALVLLCLGVIVWSMLFTGSVDHRVDRETQIPPAPEIEPVLDTPPQRPEGVPSVADNQLPSQPTLPPMDGEPDDGQGVRAASEPPPLVEAEQAETENTKPEPSKSVSQPPAEKPTADSSQSEAPKKPGLDKRGLPEAWVVQVGSFGSRANADKLVQRLRARGYKAFHDQFSSGGRELYRVQVGPVLEEARARSLKTEIDQGFNVKSIVNRFEG
ncbi:SPOR domain-containing protein [Spongiibacter taiwanensis]|uniref:SPOR domain-containing protein n=1 Tax=Spongiibacter taiwanensis TaxID=1748242 RepID=UPI00203508DF|nr:SPOR domain-containing protein [Spongiibacter taiwanensis]USA43199.1 SPOR domain-containing protein [Spongiibacter taiwanensis]